MKIPKRLKHLNKKFLFGFEVECIYSNDKLAKSLKVEYADFDDELRKIHKDIDLGSDGSVCRDNRLDNEDFNDEMEAEIRTPPLPPKEAFRVLKEVFNLLKKCGYTNESCGFHLNFSPVSERLYKRLNPFKFTRSTLWNKIKQDFDRMDNEYCNPVWENCSQKKKKTKKSQLEKFINLIDGDDYYDYDSYKEYPNVGKDADVNLDYYTLDKDEESRVEIRAFGNEGYHTKFNLIRSYANRIIGTYIRCCKA